VKAAERARKADFIGLFDGNQKLKSGGSRAATAFDRAGLFAMGNSKHPQSSGNDFSGAGAGDYYGMHSYTLSSTPALPCCRIGFRHVAMRYSPIHFP
jgi:hypothetical protein